MGRGIQIGISSKFFQYTLHLGSYLTQLLSLLLLILLIGLLHLVDRSTLPQSQKRINCPNCRRRTNVGEIAYVDNAYERLGPDSPLRELYEGESSEEEHAFPVKGSYGTKVPILWDH